MKPDDAMKKLVWSEAIVTGGAPVSLRLPPLPATVGPFQSIPRGDGTLPGTSAGYARDALVLAFPAPSAAADDDAPAVTVSGYPVDGSPLATGDVRASISLPAGTPEQPTNLTFTYSRPRTIRSATLFLRDAAVPFQAPHFLPVLEARIAGRWKRIADMPIEAVPTTVSFDPVEADAVRVVLATNPRPIHPVIDNPAPGVAVDIDTHAAARTIAVTTFAVSGEPRVDRFEAKAGYATTPDYDALGSSDRAAMGADPARVLDITASMAADGTLAWSPPPGRWRILRLGYALLGTTNNPAPAEATGLEVDKYDPQAVERYLDTYLNMYRATVGPALFGKRGLQTLVTDSVEAGNANWTPAIIADFRRLRGYDPTPFLPALTGTIVGSRAASDAFLYDFRRTLADLTASAHYGTIARIAHANHLTLFGEALETGRPQLGDDLAMRSHADIPMAALWTFNPALGPNPTYVGDMRGAASVAHVYGRRYVAAETMTAGLASYAFAPSDLKRVIDMAFASGINRPVIHSSVHQPVDDKKPGLTLSVFGQYFNRHETWAEQAKPWIDYIARSAYLLQQGSNVADLAVFIGEEAPVTAQWADGRMSPGPAGHAYDYVNSDMLINAMSVRDGDILTKGGARYRALFLGGSSHHMTVPTLKALERLRNAGATIIGTRPVASPSMADDGQEFAGLVERLWGSGPGRIIATDDIETGLQRAGIAPDLSCEGTAQDMPLFVHRRLPQGDIYFLHSTSAEPAHLKVSFRVAGRVPELWRADSGRMQAVSYRIEGDRTVVPLDLAPEDSLFLVFRRKAEAPSAAVPTEKATGSVDISADWDIRFGPTAQPVHLPRLIGWNASSEADIRYYSGTASYTRTIDAPAGHVKGRPVWLDLGSVGDLARVRVNGVDVGTAWHAPFRLDIGGQLRPGRNELRIEVTNLWVNRLIGDAQPGARRTSFTTALPYLPTAPLRPSGLIGPVTLTTVAR